MTKTLLFRKRIEPEPARKYGRMAKTLFPAAGKELAVFIELLTPPPTPHCIPQPKAQKCNSHPDFAKSTLCGCTSA